MKLLVIDIQKGITDSRLFNFDEFIDNTSRIIQAARDNQIEVIYFQHDDGLGTGFSIGDEEFEIAEQVHPREGEKIFTKNINSCFGNKDFTDYVKDENTLMIVGLQTSLLNWKIRILGGNDHEENTNIVAMSFTYGLNHGLWYTVNKAD